MIIGIGSDIVAKQRISNLLISYKNRFLEKIFTANEITLLKETNLAGYVANRFAAKEAFAKALGTGIGEIVSFQDLEIFKDPKGKPFFKLSAKLSDFIKQNHGDNIKTHLTMSNESEYAQAFVVIEKLLQQAF